MIIVLIIGRLKSGKNNGQKDSFFYLNEEGKKLFQLTKNNTLANRDIRHKKENYLKKIQPEYEEIYGDKGIKFCQNKQKEEKKENKKIGRVKFSSIVEYSRN